jgi:hypothetical protein
MSQPNSNNDSPRIYWPPVPFLIGDVVCGFDRDLSEPGAVVTAWVPLPQSSNTNDSPLVYWSEPLFLIGGVVCGFDRVPTIPGAAVVAQTQSSDNALDGLEWYWRTLTTHGWVPTREESQRAAVIALRIVAERASGGQP